MAATGSKHTDLTDVQLVKMALDGFTQDAYSVLYQRYHEGIRTHVSKFVKDREDIEDICMESLMKAFGQLDKYDQTKKFSTWVLAIARNTAFDHITKSNSKSRSAETASLDEPTASLPDVPDDARNPIDAIIEGQDHENFIKCIDGLSALYSEVARLCFIDNLGYNEISLKTGLPINTVKTRIKRAKDQILRMMQDMEE